MVGMRFRPDGLGAAAAAQRDASDAVELAVATLAQQPVGPAVFGALPAAGELAGALERARTGHARRMAAEVTARRDLADRVARTSDLGTDLVARTAALASAGGPPRAEPGPSDPAGRNR
jgi:hypothetical protein